MLKAVRMGAANEKRIAEIEQFDSIELNSNELSLYI